MTFLLVLCAAYRCSHCQQKVTAVKRLTVHRPPPCLTIHLKRFQFVQLYGGSKIKGPVQFTETLDMAPYLSFPDTAKLDGSHLYRLHGVLVHSGSSTDCGHYYSFNKSASGQWYRCDDTHVRFRCVCAHRSRLCSIFSLLG